LWPCFGRDAIAQSKPHSCHGPESMVRRWTRGWGGLWLGKDLCLLFPPFACLELQHGMLPGRCLGCPWLLCLDSMVSDGVAHPLFQTATTSTWKGAMPFPALWLIWSVRCALQKDCTASASGITCTERLKQWPCGCTWLRVKS